MRGLVLVSLAAVQAALVVALVVAAIRRRDHDPPGRRSTR